VKVDDLSAPIYFAEEVEMIRKAINRTGRKIVLSTSPGETPIAHATHVQQNANMWHTVDDFWDNWKMLKNHFDVFERWNPYRINGAWPDGDMLPLGNLPTNDAFTLALLTNKDVLNVQQHSINNKQLFRKNDTIAWIADDPKTGDKYVALFNASELDSVQISISLQQLGFTKSCLIKDLWAGKVVGKFSGEFVPYIRKHGAGMYRLSKK